jgi:hypothetical protein
MQTHAHLAPARAAHAPGSFAGLIGSAGCARLVLVCRRTRLAPARAKEEPPGEADSRSTGLRPAGPADRRPQSQRASPSPTRLSRSSTIPSRAQGRGRRGARGGRGPRRGDARRQVGGLDHDLDTELGVRARCLRRPPVLAALTLGSSGRPRCAVCSRRRSPHGRWAGWA